MKETPTLQDLTDSELLQVLKSVKAEIKNRNLSAKEFHCGYCLKVFRSRNKKTLCPECRYRKDKECKKIWARNNFKKKKTSVIQSLRIEQKDIPHDINTIVHEQFSDLIGF